MSLERGTVLGHYEIVPLVGRGGMGEVYKARDTRLGRFVAIKYRPWACGSCRRPASVRGGVPAYGDARSSAASAPFTTSAAPSGSLYLVMEFLEGQSLADRSRHGPLARSEALGYAIEIADAVHHAHRHGVIHRDLKPANVFITSSGIKVLDFGLAKLRHRTRFRPRRWPRSLPLPIPRAMESVAGTPDISRLNGSKDIRPTCAAMSSDSARSSTKWRRGVAPSRRRVKPPLIAAILASDPPPLPPGSPAMDVDWIIRRCLCRNPEDRWQSLGDVAATLKWTARGSGAIPESSPADHRRTRAPMLLAAALLIPAVVIVAFLTRPPREVSVNFPVAVSVLPPPGGAFTGTQSSVDAAQLAISPDGRRLAFVASGPSGVSQIWVRPLDDRCDGPARYRGSNVAVLVA